MSMKTQQFLKEIGEIEERGRESSTMAVKLNVKGNKKEKKKKEKGKIERKRKEKKDKNRKIIAHRKR